MTDQTPAPAPVPTAAPTDPLTALAAELAAIRGELASLKGIAQPIAAPVPVPTTDEGRPTVTPRTPDYTTLPPVARMAAGYNRK